MIWPAVDLRLTVATRRRRLTPGARDRGFTLIEILVVLAILGLTVGLVAARGPARSQALDLRSGADQVARSLRLARSQAIAGNRDVAFTLDLARRSFHVGDGPWQALPPAIELGMVTANGAADAPAQGGIVFAPDGGATGGRVRLATANRVLIIAVDWLSGRVAVVNGQ